MEIIYVEKIMQKKVYLFQISSNLEVIFNIYSSSVNKENP